jgi:hypothetical protein
LRGKHNSKFGTELQYVASSSYFDVFQQQRIEAVENFPRFDRNGDGQVTWDDLLFAVTQQSACPSKRRLCPEDFRIRTTAGVPIRYEVSF